MRPLNRNVSTVLILVLAPVLIPGSIFYCFALRIPRRIELESQYSDLDFFLLCVMRPRVGIPKPESQSSSDLGPGPDPIPISISDQSPFFTTLVMNQFRLGEVFRRECCSVTAVALENLQGSYSIR